LKITLQQDSLTPAVRQMLGNLPTARRRILRRLADAFAGRAKANIGDTGLDRPKPWGKLTNKYAKRVKREYATLKVSGALQDSIRESNLTDNSVEVGSDLPYAAVHQFGGGNNLPERPYFPATETGLTPGMEAEMDAIVEEELSRLMQ
jgi:phage gpG-like protein